MIPDRIELLVIEDNPDDVVLLRRSLDRGQPGLFFLRSADSLAEGLSAVAEAQPEIVLLDNRLPDATAAQSLETLRRVSRAPIIVVTGKGDAELAIDLQRLGAEHFFLKEELASRLLSRVLVEIVDRGRSEGATRAAQAENAELQLQLRRGEEDRQTLGRLSAELLEATSEAEVAELAAGLAATLLGASHVTVLVAEGDRPRIAALRGWPPAWKGLEPPGTPASPQGLLGLCWRQGGLIVSEDSQTDPRFSATDVDREHGAHAAIAAPFVIGDQRLGALTCHWARPGAVTPERLRNAQSLAHLTTLALERARSLEALRRAQAESLDRERRLFEGEKLRSLGQLAAGIVHEINSPLSAAVMTVESLQSQRPLLAELGRLHGALAQPEGPRPVTAGALGRFVEDLPEALAETHAALQQVVKIVREMRTYSHPGGGDQRPSDIERIVETAVTIARASFKYTSQLRLELTPLPQLVCDSGKIGQLLVNLVVNASQAIGKSRADGLIVVRARQEGADALIEVSDNGPGMSEEIQRRLFTPFFTTKAPGEGTGLGLSLCQRIAADHGGTLRVQSSPGAGATFVLRLPLSGAREAAVA